jgi:hypothetical protein
VAVLRCYIQRGAAIIDARLVHVSPRGDEQRHYIQSIVLRREQQQRDASLSVIRQSRIHIRACSLEEHRHDARVTVFRCHVQRSSATIVARHVHVSPRGDKQCHNIESIVLRAKNIGVLPASLPHIAAAAAPVSSGSWGCTGSTQL